MRMITLYSPKRRKVVSIGKVENSLYIKKVIRSKHFIRNYQGYAISKSVIEGLLKENIATIVVLEDTGVRLEISIPKFIEHGQEFDYGYGVQIAVNEKHFNRTNNNQITMEI